MCSSCIHSVHIIFAWVWPCYIYSCYFEKSHHQARACLTRPKSAGDSPKLPAPCFVRLFAHKSQALTPAMDTGLVRPGVIPPGLGARDPHAATLCAGEPAEDVYNTHTDVSCQRRTVGPPPNHDKMTHSTYLTSHAHVVCLYSVMWSTCCLF